MGTTPFWKIPYPEDTATVRQGAQAMKALATRVDLIGGSIDVWAHTAAGAVTVPSGGTSGLGYIPNTVIPAKDKTRIMLVIVKGYATSLTATDLQMNLRDNTSGTSLALQYIRTQALSTVTYWMGTLPANTIAQYQVVVVAGGAATLSGDGRYAGMDVIGFTTPT